MKTLIPLILSTLVALSSTWCDAASMAQREGQTLEDGGPQVPRPMQQQGAQDKAVYQRQLTALLDSLRSTTRVPGYSVAVVQGGKLIASATSGYANIKQQKKVTSQTLFRLASVSKVKGATMLAELVQTGKLDPDKPIVEYLPELPKHYHSMTARQLLAHTSGLPHYQMVDYDIAQQHYETALAALATLKKRKLLSLPGENYAYSSHGYTLAGALYEKVSGSPLSLAIPAFLSRWTQKHTPLIEDIRNLPAQASQLYKLSAKGAVEEELGEKSYSVFGAGLLASATDLAFFGDAVLGKTRAQPEYAELLFTPVKTTNGKWTGTEKYKVAFGWRVAQDFSGRRVYHHAGVTPGARSVIVLYPDAQLSIALLSNSSWVSSIDQTAFSLAGLWLDAMQAVPMADYAHYQLQHGQSRSRGRLNCAPALCRMTDDSSSYTAWLNTFNYGSSTNVAWPLYLFQRQWELRLLLISVIGIQTLSLVGEEFVFPMVRQHPLRIRLLRGEPDD